MMHAWHDVSPGNDLPRDFQAVIEIPLGSNVKYELDKASGLLRRGPDHSFGGVLPGELWIYSADVRGG